MTDRADAVRLAAIRETIMRHAATRASAEAVVAGMLAELDAYDDDELVETLLGEPLARLDAATGAGPFTAGELRRRLRGTLADLAEREGEGGSAEPAGFLAARGEGGSAAGDTGAASSGGMAPPTARGGAGPRAPAGSFTCPVCGRVSHHPEDVRHGYCGACHAFTGEGAGR
jgi:hypothetical protein